MTDEELHDLILGDDAAKAKADAGDDTGAAARASVIAPTLLVKTRETYMAIADHLGDKVARRLIDTVNAVADSDVLVSEARYQLRDSNGGIDVSHALTRAMLDSFADNTNLPLTPDDAAAIKALAEQPQAITAEQVSRAWSRYRPGGRISA